jgi:hypothetical protein
VNNATVSVANELSAQLTGPPDRLDIKLRGDEKMRTISSPVPITWVWDVKPLKPGKTDVTLEVISYIKRDSNKVPVPIKVFQETWQVYSSWWEWLKYWALESEAIRTLLAAVAGILARLGIDGWRRKLDFET